jgi:glycerol-3-phosphate dehydrogenase (NAD(P)+)
MTNITIIGAGVWGTALSSLASHNGHEVCLWSRRSPEKLEDVFNSARILLSAVSMSGVSAVVTQLQSLPVSPDTIFITATKGLDSTTAHTPHKFGKRHFPQIRWLFSPDLIFQKKFNRGYLLLVSLLALMLKPLW